MVFSPVMIRKPTYEELEARLEETLSQLAQTSSRLAQTSSKLAEMQHFFKLALDRIAALEEQINKNSKNSSKSPSSDKKANTGDKDKKVRKPRPGVNRTLLPLEEIDHQIDCTLNSCPHCGSMEIIDQGQSIILQQAELPEVQAIITQFNRLKYRCAGCHHISLGELPIGTPNSSFGPRLMSLVATLTGAFHLAKRDVQQLLKDIYGVDICEGSVINIEERVSHSLRDVYERIHHFVVHNLLTKHFDETSWRDRGKNSTVWVASTRDAVCFRIDPRRNREAFHKIAGIFNGAPIVTDRYAVYNKITSPHQYCLAHLIRDTRKYAERDDSDGLIGTALEKELKWACKIQKRFRSGEIKAHSRGQLLAHSKKRLDQNLLDGLANGSDELAKLCGRLLDDFEKLWTFGKFKDVDPTNNLAERDLRKLVLWRKKSYGTRSEKGQRFVERITSVVETLKRSGENVLSFINRSVSAFYSREDAPLIFASSSY